MAAPLDKSVICPILIGRAPDLEALNQLIEQVREGALYVALVAGEAGIGKSRLVAETKTLAARLGFRTLQGHCFEPDRALPYAPLLDLLRTFCATRSAEEISRDLGPIFPELVKLLPELVTLFPDLTPTPPLEPEQEKRRLFQVLTQCFIHLSTPVAGAQPHRPLLIVIEDLHWSDDTSLEFLLFLAHHIAAQPILLLLTYRSDEVHPALQHFLAGLDRERLAAEFRLSHLALGEVDILIRAIFNQPGPVRAEFLEAVYALTDGNPFFIEEILKALIASGEIFYTYGVWNRKPMSELHIPRTVQDAVQRRTQQLSEAAKQILILAAVAGRRFDFSLLQQLTRHDERDLVKMIKELIAAQLVVEESAERFAFRHTLTRQAVYAQLLARERKALHQTIAETSERVYAEALDTHLADLAYHFYEAGAWEKALEYAQRAGEQAQRLYAPRAAGEQFTRAIEAARHLSLVPQPTLYRARGQTCELLGEFAGAREDYTRALDAARDSGDRIVEWQSLLDLGFLWTGHDYERAGDYLQQALALARSLSEPSTLAHTLNRVGNWHANIEQPLEGRRHHEEALAIFQGLNDRHGLAATLDLLATTSYVGGDMRAGARYFEQAATLFRELDDRQGLASCMSMLALRTTNYICDTTVCLTTSRAESLQECEEVLRIARQIHWRAGEANIQNFLGLVLGPRGEYAHACACVQSALEIAEEIGHGVVSTIGHFALGALYLDLYALPAAQRHLEQALTLAKEIRWPFMIGSATRFLASTYVAQHDLARAESLLNAASGPAPASGYPATQTLGQRQVWYARAELALARGDPAAALQIVDRLIASAANVEDGRVIPRLWHLRGVALATLNRMAEAETTLQAAHDRAQAQGTRSLLWRIYVSLGKYYQAQGRREQAEGAFSAARSIVEELAANLTDATAQDDFTRHATALLPPAPTQTPRQATKRAFGGLTEREREVAALVAQGKTNRAIAEALVLSQRTVQVHITNIMSKLDFTSRAQIAVWAAEKGLTSGEVLRE